MLMIVINCRLHLQLRRQERNHVESALSAEMVKQSEDDNCRETGIKLTRFF
jgi:hypothetical protein